MVNEKGILHTSEQSDGTGSIQFIAWEDVRLISCHQSGTSIKINVKQSIDPNLGQGMFFKNMPDVISVYRYLVTKFVSHVTKEM